MDMSVLRRARDELYAGGGFRTRRPVKVVDLERGHGSNAAIRRSHLSTDDGDLGAVHHWCIGVEVADLSVGLI